MSTELTSIKSTNGVEDSELFITVFAGHSDLVTSGKETTRRCIQLTPAYGIGYSHLTESGIKELIEKLQSVLDGTYSKFED